MNKGYNIELGTLNDTHAHKELPTLQICHVTTVESLRGVRALRSDLQIRSRYHIDTHNQVGR